MFNFRAETALTKWLLTKPNASEFIRECLKAKMEVEIKNGGRN